MMIHHGTLDVPSSIEPQYEAAKRYLSRDPVERRLFEKLEHARDGRHYTIAANHRDQDYFDPANGTIGWDPYSALRTTSGGRQTPALGLGHEVDHAVENPSAAATLRNRFDPVYDNAEERRVITGSETQAARMLGESVRHDHGGTTYRVTSPVIR